MLGLAGKPCKNEDAKQLAKKHNRIVLFSHQSRHVSDGMRKGQEDAHAPPHKILTTVRTCPTRWGNQKEQVSANCLLQPVITSTVSSYKRDNRQNKEAIVEHDEQEEMCVSRAHVSINAEFDFSIDPSMARANWLID